jgi:glycosyltransferase involved in cell wall biosynthesis
LKKLLSIAIPFYNGFETIVSILNELAESNDLNYEIIISDDCSEAQQSDKLLNFIDVNFSSSNISYHRNSINLGMDMNFQKCIELSNGDYTWFLGQDDFIYKHKLLRVMDLIHKFNPNVAYLNYEIKRTWNFSNTFIHTDNANIVDGSEFKDFILTSRGNVPHFLPSLLVKTELWPKFQDLDYLVGSYFIQLGAFLQILATHKNWLYIGEPMSIGVIPSDGWQSSVEKKTLIYCGFMKCILFTYKRYPQLIYIYKQQYFKNYYQHMALSIEAKLDNNELLLMNLKSKEIFTKSYAFITSLVQFTPTFLLRLFYRLRKLYHQMKNSNFYKYKYE